MELILKQDVENLGFKDDVVTVKNGYGRNFLIPQKHIDLAQAFSNAGISVDKKFISVTGGIIKRLGQYGAVIRLHRDVTVDMTFEVIAEA